MEAKARIVSMKKKKKKKKKKKNHVSLVTP